MNISLSKALKLKSRLAGRLNKVKTTILTYNSTLEGRANEVNIPVLDKQYKELTSALVELKTAIYKANMGIYWTLNQLSEKKSEVDFLNSINTRNGVEPGYNGVNIVYLAVIKKQEVDDRVRKLEVEIDDLQDKIDKYNAEPEMVLINENVLKLVG